MVDTRYLDPSYTARYLEAEWADFVLKHGAFPDGHSEPFRFQDRNVCFYTSVVQMLAENLKKLTGFRLERFADFGCASGRFVREACENFDQLVEINGYEPSGPLCGLARQLVLGEALPERLPTTDESSGTFRWFTVTPQLQAALQNSAAGRKAKFFVDSAETAEVSAGHFDVVCCLNVLDRHDNPLALIDKLRTFLRAHGLICVSSPLEWQEECTPKDRWRNSVTEFLDEENWQVLDQRDIAYQFRVSNRRVVQYSSQVVLARRLP